MHNLHNGLRLLGGVLLISFALNYAWELAQMPAFTDGRLRPFRTGIRFAALHCFVPTLGDIFVAGMTFVLGWAINGRPDWILRLGWREILLVTLPLVLLAVTVELVNVYVLQQWSYSRFMPIVPIIRVGLLPTVQLALLTLLTFYMVGRYVNWRLGSRALA